MRDKSFLDEKLKNIRQLVVEDSLSEANYALDQMIRSGEFRKYILEDAKNPKDLFLVSFLERFKFFVCPDSETFLDESDSTCKYNKSRFIRCVENLDDVVFQFTHVYSHDYCRPLWFRVPQQKSDLDPVELDHIEEIFGFYVLVNDFKTIYKTCPSSFQKIALYFEMPLDQDFNEGSQIYEVAGKMECVELDKIREWLSMQSDIHHPNIFPIFIKCLFLIKHLDSFRAQLNFKYRSVIQHKRVHEKEIQV